MGSLSLAGGALKTHCSTEGSWCIIFFPALLKVGLLSALKGQALQDEVEGIGNGLQGGCR